MLQNGLVTLFGKKYAQKMRPYLIDSEYSTRVLRDALMPVGRLKFWLKLYRCSEHPPMLAYAIDCTVNHDIVFRRKSLQTVQKAWKKAVFRKAISTSAHFRVPLKNIVVPDVTPLKNRAVLYKKYSLIGQLLSQIVDISNIDNNHLLVINLYKVVYLV